MLAVPPHLEVGEAVEIGVIVEITKIHADFAYFSENMVGFPKRLGEYPTTLRQKHSLPKAA